VKVFFPLMICTGIGMLMAARGVLLIMRVEGPLKGQGRIEKWVVITKVFIVCFSRMKREVIQALRGKAAKAGQEAAKLTRLTELAKQGVIIHPRYSENSTKTTS
jgi:hypothetical protein